MSSSKKSTIGRICLFIALESASFGVFAAQRAADGCEPPINPSSSAPDGLQINGEHLASNLTSLLATVSRPLEIKLAAEPTTDPLRITLSNPKDKGYVIQSSPTAWTYWPGFRGTLDKANP